MTSYAAKYRCCFQSWHININMEKTVAAECIVLDDLLLTMGRYLLCSASSNRGDDWESKTWDMSNWALVECRNADSVGFMWDFEPSQKLHLILSTSHGVLMYLQSI
jgi:hypothetical protein